MVILSISDRGSNSICNSSVNINKYCSGSKTVKCNKFLMKDLLPLTMMSNKGFPGRQHMKVM